MNPVLLGTVYQVTGQTGTKLTVRVIWVTSGPVSTNETFETDESELIPFDADRFG